MNRLETQRLYLRGLEPGDAQAMAGWRNDPDCARYQRWAARTPEEIAAVIARCAGGDFLSDAAEQHFVLCARDGRAVGELAYFFAPGDCVTLGVTIAGGEQKKGYAHEILSAVIKKIRGAYPALDIVALIEPENEASCHLFGKLGFAREGYAETIHSYVYTLPGQAESDAFAYQANTPS